MAGFKRDTKERSGDRELNHQAFAVSKNDWICLYVDLYRQTHGETANAEDAYRDAMKRLDILKAPESKRAGIGRRHERRGWRGLASVEGRETMQLFTKCAGCGVYRTCWGYGRRDLCRDCLPVQARVDILGRLAPNLTPAMEIALREWIDRVGATADYRFPQDVFSERGNQATAWRKACGRLAAAGYLEADEAFIAAHWPSVVPPYRVTDKALDVLEISHELTQPKVVVVDNLPF